MKRSVGTTLWDLFDAVHSVTTDDREAIATVLHIFERPQNPRDSRFHRATLGRAEPIE